MKRSVVLLVLLIFAACSDEGQLTAPDPPPAPQQVSDLTPFQQSIQSSMDERAREGLPVPEVSFDFTSDNGASLSTLQGYPGSPGESFTMVATTTIRYDNPEEAGFDRWPATVIQGEIPPEEGFVRQGDYTDVVRDYVAARLPGYWDTHVYGLEPRTKRIVETMKVTYGEPGQSGPLAASTQDDLVHGFTITGPNIDWTVSGEACTGVGDLEVCAYKFRAGFAFDYAFGVRLPMRVGLDFPAAVNEGTTFAPTTTAQGVDWSATDYSAAGIAPESGNEYVSRYEFFLGAHVDVAEIPVISWGPDVDKDRSSSFATPFGPGALFSLPSLDLPLASESVAKASVEFGAYAKPKAGSDKFTADWAASSGLTGSGSLEYTDPSIPRFLSNVFAPDGPATGNLRINNTKYVFNQFQVELGAYFDVDIFSAFTHRYDIPITDFDLSNLIPDISVPVHAGASPTTLNAGVTVLNVAPTVGGLTGVPAGPVAILDQPVAIGADFTDPAGAADVPYTCAVDHGDGTGALAGAVSGMTCAGPDHTYAEPGVYNVVLDVTDKDNGTGSRGSDVPIVIYDPDGGFVTGGGWIDSPAGAYVPDPSLSGKATFGFVSKYKRGATVPDGNTTFQFETAGLEFYSDSYEWLVVNQGGANAQFKGVGTVNGTGEYKFMLWATDGDPDTFRIRIWEEVGGVETVLYDNGGQVLGGGSIVIHTK